MPASLTDMKRANTLVDEADDPVQYQARLVALALIARQYLREIAKTRPDCEFGDCRDHYGDPAAWCEKCQRTARGAVEPPAPRTVTFQCLTHGAYTLDAQSTRTGCPQCAVEPPAPKGKLPFFARQFMEAGDIPDERVKYDAVEPPAQPKFDIMERLHGILTNYGIASRSLKDGMAGLPGDLIKWAADSHRQSLPARMEPPAQEPEREALQKMIANLEAEAPTIQQSVTWTALQHILFDWLGLRGANPSPPPATPQEWQPIDARTPRNDEVFFWVRAKTAEESYTDTSGKPIVSNHRPYLHKGKYGSWGALSTPTHWMPLPAAPHGADRNE